MFAVALALSMGGLAYALRTIPTGTGYAVWVGIGAALTVAFAMATGQEPASLAKVALLVMLTLMPGKPLDTSLNQPLPSTLTMIPVAASRAMVA